VSKRSKKPQREIGCDVEIVSFLHCALCLAEKPRGQSPKEWARTQAGFTKLGIQIICTRHDVNICHIDFEGQVHPANTDRRKLPAELSIAERKARVGWCDEHDAEVLAQHHSGKGSIKDIEADHLSDMEYGFDRDVKRLEEVWGNRVDRPLAERMARIDWGTNELALVYQLAGDGNVTRATIESVVSEIEKGGQDHV